MARNQICASDVYQRIISLQISQNQTLRIRRFTGTQRSLKLVHKYKRELIRRQKILQMKASHIRYMCILHGCLLMQKVLEEIMVTA